jgi:cytochrome P450
MDPAMWGPDAAKFRPERWIEKDEFISKMEKAKHPYPLWSNLMTFFGEAALSMYTCNDGSEAHAPLFAGGRRGCIGYR